MGLKPVRIGIIGCDGYASELIKRLRTLPEDGRLTAAMSPILDSPGAVDCRERGIPVHEHLDAMLEAGGFDVVINATPIHVHGELTRRCLEAGYSVWLEKPPTATIQELDELVAASAASGLPVAVGFNWLHLDLIRELKAELVAGRYGAIQRIRGIGAWVRREDYFTRNQWAGRLRMGDDWVLDGTINNPFSHVVCNGLYLAGTRPDALAVPASVEAELYHANAIESEDTSCLRILTRDGVELLTHLTLAPDGEEIAPTTVVETEAAVIELRDFATMEVRWRDGRTEQRQSTSDSRVEMLQRQCRAFGEGAGYPCDLAMCRPFTIAVNGAFDASGTVWTIPSSCLRRDNRDGVLAVATAGINDILRRAHTEGALFSEMGVPWARAGLPQPVTAYTTFPVRFGHAAPTLEVPDETTVS